MLEKNFPTEIHEDNGQLSLSFGALKRLSVSIDKKKLIADSESDKGAKDDVILDTNKRFRVFLEEATGYSAKERLKMAKKAVQGD